MQVLLCQHIMFREAVEVVCMRLTRPVLPRAARPPLPPVLPVPRVFIDPEEGLLLGLV